MSGELPCPCGSAREPFFVVEDNPREDGYEACRLRVSCCCGEHGPWAKDSERAIELWNAEVEEAMKEGTMSDEPVDLVEAEFAALGKRIADDVRKHYLVADAARAVIEAGRPHIGTRTSCDCARCIAWIALRAELERQE